MFMLTTKETIYSTNVNMFGVVIIIIIIIIIMIIIMKTYAFPLRH